jgi:hypothetical protein
LKRGHETGLTYIEKSILAFRANHPDVVLDATIDDAVVYIVAGRGVAFELTRASFSQLRILQKNKPFEPASARSDQMNGEAMLSA